MLRPSNRPAKPGDICMVTHWLAYGKQVVCLRQCQRFPTAWRVKALEPMKTVRYAYSLLQGGYTGREIQLTAGQETSVDKTLLVPLDDWKDDEVTEQKEMPHGQAV